MNVEAFLLCDAATDQRGKLNVLGAFDTIWAKQLPITHPACSIALRIRFEVSEEGDHPVKIQIIDQDGKGAGPKLEGNINVKAGGGRDSIITNLILNIQGLKFEGYGKYRIDLIIDNQKIADLPFAVREVPNKALGNPLN
jgi:Family of unknown function (DUF6941)